MVSLSIDKNKKIKIKKLRKWYYATFDKKRSETFYLFYYDDDNGIDFDAGAFIGSWSRLQRFVEQ